ncbi:rRNA-processing protein Ebp2p [[Candida] jaroonii]|uniref:rRNA-processing protein Ebp2p n=1 Tax=[Candida] jaroonii TaxID=467808 RepID=A0ACA9YGE5_9ASCO|nr:rRNA-processing protein Ebp2p [[Candida] jaroonii]
MAKKGSKAQLGAEALLESIDKSRSKPQSKETVEAKPVKPVKAKPVKKVKEKDYESSVLSKKEQRKLKKQLKEQEEEEQEEQEEEPGFIDDEAEEASDDEEEDLDFNKLAESESDSEIDEEEQDDDEDEEEQDDEDDEEQDEEEEEEEDIPLSDVEIDSDADVVPHTKLTINNTAALGESLARIALPWSKHSFVEHQSITGDEKTELSIKDIYDDTERELAFYKQGLDAVKQGRANLLKLKVPFSRPMDYFAEMVKSDEHMDKLKNKLMTEAANKKASEEAKRQRQLKKFGKQVQHETLQNRAKEKRDTLDKVKNLKKRKANHDLGDDEFQIALEEATKENSRVDKERHANGRNGDKRQRPNGKRLAKDAKYGFGGKKRFLRKNDAQSSADVSGFSSKKMKNQRPGKSKRSRRH